MSECKPCDHALEHGWWGDALPSRHTHCQECHATWPGSNKWGHCARCHQTFSGVSTFDLHQTMTKNGEDYTSTCLCSRYREAGTRKESLSGSTQEQAFPVSKKMTLELREHPWGWAWHQPGSWTGPKEATDG